MTSFVFPTLTGLTFPMTREYQWNTEKQKALSGKRSTLQLMAYPLVHFECVFSLLRDDLTPSDLKSLVGLFNACAAGYDTFLYQDPDNNSVTTQNFGTGDGATTTFPITMTYGNSGGPSYPELIQNFNSTPQIFVSGTLQTAGTAYTLGATGIVTFLGGHIPVAAAPITWTGTFYYRCEFDDDNISPSKFLNKWWELKKLQFTSVKL